MKIHSSNIGLWAGVVAVVVVMGLAKLVGYGDGHLAIKQQAVVAQKAYCYEDSSLDVIYERSFNGKQDWLHLKVDTTYHKIGKADYTYKVLCNRTFSLRAYDSEYEDWGNGYKHCFVEGESERRWSALPHSSGKLLGYKVDRACASSHEIEWEALYTNELPLVAEGATATDSYRGLILEARSRDDRYKIRAKDITLNIG